MKGLIIAALTWVTAAVPSAMAAPPELTDLKIVREGDSFVVSCRLSGGLSPKILEEIDAGLETTFAYRVRVHRRRLGLPNPVVAEHRIQCTVKRDALTRQYTLTRRIDDELDERRLTTDPAVMRSFMTTLDQVPIAQITQLQAREEHYLKIKSDLGLMWRFYLIPTRLDTAWVRVPIDLSEGTGRDSTP